MEKPEIVVGNLKFLTEATVKEILKLEVVTPSIYRNVFLEYAEKHNIDFNNEERIYSEFASDKFNKYQRGFINTVEKIKVGIKVARRAIKNRDEKSLVKIERKIELLDKYIKNLESELFVDHLTGLNNRKWLFDKFLREEVLPFSGTLVFVDLNNFKFINDTYGHLWGDNVLKTIADIFAQIENSYCIRYAGDEFILIFKDYSNNEIEDIIKKTKDYLEKTTITIEDAQVQLSFAYGTAEFKTRDNFFKILDEADKKMYQDKGSSR